DSLWPLSPRQSLDLSGPGSPVPAHDLLPDPRRVQPRTPSHLRDRLLGRGRALVRRLGVPPLRWAGRPGEPVRAVAPHGAARPNTPAARQPCVPDTGSAPLVRLG